MLRAIPDPRKEKSLKYPLPFLAWTGIMLFLCKLGARRQINFNFDTPEFISNINLLAGTEVNKMEHHDTLHYLLKRVNPKHFSDIRYEMINRLIRMRALENWRLLDEYYIMAFDGTGMLYFKERHCENCLEITIKGKKYYYHHILEAKLILANGMSLSIDSEFIENSDPKPDKQDCELKAFYRLAPRVKAKFPQLRICILLDSLYAGEPVFDTCKKYHWKYIITFKEGSIPSLFSEFESLKSLTPKNTINFEDSDVIQDHHWVTNIPHQDSEVNVIDCVEIKKKPRSGRNPKTRFVWLTNIPVNKRNCHKVANHGGRLRWKIENEGFNMQKNGGYNMEHAYSFQEYALKNFYILLQIAHIIAQLMEKGSLLKNKIKNVFGCIRNIAVRLLENLRNQYESFENFRNLLSKPFQIRLDSS